MHKRWRADKQVCVHAAARMVMHKHLLGVGACMPVECNVLTPAWDV